MTTRKIFSIIFILSLIALISCDKDDDKSKTETEKPFGTGFVSGEKGSSFEIIRNGVKESCVGDKMFGWEKGALLNLNRFSQVRMGCNERSFILKFSIPQAIQFTEIAEDEHELAPNRLLLEYTQDLSEVTVEFFENHTQPTIQGNGSGSVKIERDVIISGKTYSLVGCVDCQFYYNGAYTTVKGYFWSENAPW